MYDYSKQKSFAGVAAPVHVLQSCAIIAAAWRPRRPTQSPAQLQTSSSSTSTGTELQATGVTMRRRFLGKHASSNPCIATLIMTLHCAAAERHVSVGVTHACIVSSDSAIACDGTGSDGQTIGHAGPFHAVTVGERFTCGLFTNGSAMCWGALAGVAPYSLLARGADFLDLHAAAVGAHVCGLHYDGSVECFGDNTDGACTSPEGQLFKGISAGPQYSCGVTQANGGTVVCWGSASHPVVSGTRPSGGGFVHVATGSRHACALRTNGSVHCWGDAASGIASVPPSPEGGFLYLTSGADVTCGITGAGLVNCWGVNAAAGSHVAAESGISRALEVSCGSNRCWVLGLQGTNYILAGAHSFAASRTSWIERGPRLASPDSWGPIASSSNGAKLVAAARVGGRTQVYTSADSGVTWTARSSPHSDRSISGMASSSDGIKLVVTLDSNVMGSVTFRAQIYTSTDSGVSWTARLSIGGRWMGFASSSDGAKLVALEAYACNDLASAQCGQIHTSTDSGVSWTPRVSVNTRRNWQSAGACELQATRRFYLEPIARGLILERLKTLAYGSFPVDLLLYIFW